MDPDAACTDARTWQGERDLEHVKSSINEAMSLSSEKVTATRRGKAGISTEKDALYEGERIKVAGRSRKIQISFPLTWCR